MMNKQQNASVCARLRVHMTVPAYNYSKKSVLLFNGGIIWHVQHCLLGICPCLRISMHVLTDIASS